MAGEKLAELYLEIRAKGDINKTLDDLHARIQSTNKLMTGFEGNAQNLFFFKLRDAAKEATFAIKVAEAALQHTGTAAGQKELKNLYGLQAKRRLIDDKQSLEEVKIKATHQATPEGKAQLKETVAVQSARDLYDAQAKLSELKAKTAFQESTEGKAFLREQLAVQKEVQKFKAGHEWQRLLAEQGRFGANMLTLKDKIGDFTRYSAIGLAAATAGITGLVAAASPETFQTFTGSLHLLSASVGQIFVPTMINVAGWLQRTAFWFHGLSGETKHNIASLALWGVGGMGAVVVGGIVVRAVTAVTIGYRASSIAAASAALANHGLAGSFNMVAAAAGRAAAAMGLARLLAGGGLILGSQLAGHAVGGGIGNAIQSVGTAAGVGGMIAGTPGAIVGGTAAAVADENTRGLVTPSWLFDRAFNRPSLRSMFGSRPPAAGTAGATGATQANQGQGTLLGYNFQSQFHSIEGNWRRMQTGAASLNPLEAQTQQWQQEMRTLVAQIARNQGIPPAAQPGDSVLE